MCALADTQPSTDTGSDVQAMLTQARRDALVRVLPLGTVSKRRDGQELSEMADMAGVGAVAFSDDSRTVRSSRLMRHALEYSLLVERPIASFAMDPELADGGVMNEGSLATVLGLKGVLKVNHAIVHGISVLNLDGFAPAARWKELSPDALEHLSGSSEVA